MCVIDADVFAFVPFVRRRGLRRTRTSDTYPLVAVVARGSKPEFSPCAMVMGPPTYSTHFSLFERENWVVASYHMHMI